MGKRLLRELTRAGLAFRPVRIANYNGMAEAPAVMVNHDYIGMYPTQEARDAARTAARIANKLHLASEPRGYYTATLIYLI